MNFMRDSTPTGSGSDGVVMTSPEVEQEILERSLTEHIPRFAVILHNDETNSMEHVVDALLKSVPTLSEQDAIKVMMDAHTDGKAVVTVCPLETAEFYRDRLQSFSIGASIEAA
jgi:ATP-dependent Clp protease adaptor protein ClpS